MENVKAVILAAGEGTRMRSPLSKLIHHVYCQSLVGNFPQKSAWKVGSVLRVEALRVNDPTIVLGVNTRKDLKRVIQIMKGKR